MCRRRGLVRLAACSSNAACAASARAGSSRYRRRGRCCRPPTSHLEHRNPRCSASRRNAGYRVPEGMRVAVMISKPYLSRDASEMNKASTSAAGSDSRLCFLDMCRDISGSASRTATLRWPRAASAGSASTAATASTSFGTCRRRSHCSPRCEMSGSTFDPSGGPRGSRSGDIPEHGPTRACPKQRRAGGD